VVPRGSLDLSETLWAGCWAVSICSLPTRAVHDKRVLFRRLTPFLRRTGYREPLVYNWKVFTSLCRQVYIAEKLAPPTSLSTWIHAYAKIWSRATSPAYYRQIAQSGEWSKVAVYVSRRGDCAMGRRGRWMRARDESWRRRTKPGRAPRDA
jgi:hypothetical protein